MTSMKKRIVFMAIPLTVLAAAGLIMKKVAKRDGRISEEVKEATSNAFEEIDSTILELKNNIEGKSASKLQHTLDSIVEKAKEKLDKIAVDVKSRIQEKGSSSTEIPLDINP